MTTLTIENIIKTFENANFDLFADLCHAIKAYDYNNVGDNFDVYTTTKNIPCVTVSFTVVNNTMTNLVVTY
jgi:hypothetical protein